MKSPIKFFIGYVITLLLAVSSPASGLSLSPGMAADAWKWYSTVLKTHPLTTKSVTSSCVMTVSDALCQKLVLDNSDDKEQSKSLDIRRMVEVAITGLTWSGPITHNWYGILEKIVKIQDPILGLIARLFLDAIIFSPVTVSGYFVWRSMLEGTGVKGAAHKIKTRLVSTVIGAWKFWPLANVINFSMVPLDYRVLYMNVLSVFWTGYLTWVNAVSKKSLEDPNKKK